MDKTDAQAAQIVKQRERKSTVVPVRARGGTDYTYDSATGQIRRRYPKPDRNKKVRRRERQK